MQISVSKLKRYLAQYKNVEWNGKKPKGNKNGPKIRGKTTAKMVLEDRGDY